MTHLTFGDLSIFRDTTDDSKIRLVLSGELDIASVDELNAEILEDADSTFVIDTTKLTFIDSTGLGALVAARNRLGHDRFELIPGEATQRVMQLSGTEEHLLDGDADQHGD